MKKLLNMLGLITLTTLTTNITTACDGYRPGTNPNPKPTPPITHDIVYYQKAITNLTIQVTQIQADITEMNSTTMKQAICGSNSICQELQQLIDSTTIELKQSQALIQDYYYQILVLQTNSNFNPTEKLIAIKYLQTELTLLTAQRLLMVKIPDYNQSDIKTIDDQILLINTELAKLIPSKGDDKLCYQPFILS